jgi:chromosome segregation ATPase
VNRDDTAITHEAIQDLRGRVGTLEAGGREHRARIEALEARYGALEQRLQRHEHLLIAHEEGLARIEKEQRKQFSTMAGKLDLVLGALGVKG